MITWRGTGYMLLTVATWIILAATGYAPLAVFLPLLIILPVVSIFRQLLLVRRLQVVQRLALSIIERGNSTALTVELRQSGWLSHGELELIIKRPGLYGRIVHERRNAVLLAGASREISWTVTGRHRGRYRPGLSRLRSRDLFGLFSLSGKFRHRLARQAPALLVLPNSNVLPTVDNLLSFLAQCEIQQNPLIGDEVDAVANIRSWRPGDSMKRTHWKISARLNQVMVKEFEYPVHKSGLLLVDLARPSDRTTLSSRYLIDLADQLTDQAASLIRHLLSRGSMLRVVAYDHAGRREVLANSPEDLLAAQMMLTDLGWSDEWNPARALIEETGRDKRNCYVVHFTSRFDEAAISQLLELRQSGIPVWLILAQSKGFPTAEQQATLHRYEANGLILTVLDQADLAIKSITV